MSRGRSFPIPSIVWRGTRIDGRWRAFRDVPRNSAPGASFGAFRKEEILAIRKPLSWEAAPALVTDDHLGWASRSSKASSHCMADRSCYTPRSPVRSSSARTNGAGPQAGGHGTGMAAASEDAGRDHHPPVSSPPPAGCNKGRAWVLHTRADADMNETDRSVENASILVLSYVAEFQRAAEPGGDQA